MVNKRRYRKTLDMLKFIMPNKGIIYDLGVDNPLSTLMREEGHEVYNTHG